MTPRPLTLRDVPDLIGLAGQAGWNQTQDDIRTLLQLAPEGCFGIEVEGRVVATATLISYGRDLAWVGMVLTHPRYQRLGFATKLLGHVLELADSSGIACVKLDATEMGRPIYERFGFRLEQPVERWSGICAVGRVDGDPSGWKALDRRANGADREVLLQAFGASISVRGASLWTRPGAQASYIGPFIAESPDAARALMRRIVRRDDGDDFYWDLLPSNRNAVELATEYGFAPARRLVRMVRGADLRGEEEFIYGIAGFEFG